MKPLLDRVLHAVRSMEIRPEEAEQAAARVLSKLTEEYNKVVPHPAVIKRITSCEDFRSLIPAYLSGSLTSAKAMLFEDHTRECVACRKATEAARTPHSLPGANVAARTRERKRAYRQAARWAVAAILLLIAGLTQRNAIQDFLWPIDVHAVAQAVDGNLFMVSETDAQTITAGARIDRNRLVRTGKESRAVLQLADGSQIEVQERSELSLDRANDGVRIRLGRGSVVVTAAKQRSGHLYVVTNDLTVSVTGTKFSVNAGVKGSRVSVVEGEVHVQNGATAQALQAGQQFASNPILSAAPPATTDLRYTSNLVNLVPANTVVFASLPNLKEAVDEAYEALKQHVHEAPAPGMWWPSEDVINRVRQLGSYLGPEIIIAVPFKEGAPVLIAETSEPESLKAAIQGLPQSDLRFPMVVDNGLLVVSASSRTIEEVLAFRRRANSNPFLSTPLYQRISTAYREGVGWFIAADLQKLLPPRPVTMELGMTDAEQLVVEQKNGKDGTSYRAVLGFNKPRRGMMGWLAEPAPMGALEFVSSNAYGVAAIAMKDPSLIVEDVFAFLQRNNPEAIRNIDDFQNQHRIDIRHDLAAPLGGEFLLAVDGPILPVPAWKIVVEVYDAARLQNTIQWAVSEMNREAAAKQQPGVSLSSETADGRTFYTASFPGAPYKVHYTFWRGYMIIAPDRTLLIEAMQYRDTGGSLARSDNFLSQLPADGRDYVSGFIYQNVSLNLPQNRVTSTTPLLICLYGEPNRIVLSSKAVIGTNISNIPGLVGLIDQIRVR
jgi:FecR-like protein/putative zinc finger protein